MDRLVAVERIATLAHAAQMRTPSKGADHYALTCLAWAKRNTLSKGETYTAGFLSGVLGMTVYAAEMSPVVKSCLFVVSEALAYDGDVPAAQVEEACAALEKLYLPEPANA